MINQNVISAALQDAGSEKMPRLSRVLGYIIDVCLFAGIALVPLFFLPITLDVLELNKQTLLMILVLIGATAWFGKALADRSFALARSWFNIVVILFTLGWLVTSLFSKDLYLSMIGNFGQMQWSFVTIATFVLFYFLLLNRTQTNRRLYDFLIAFLASSALVGLYGFLQMAGLFPLGWLNASTKSISFNTVGTINALGVYMVIPLVLATSLTLFGCKDGECELGKKARKSVLTNTVVWAALLISLAVLVVIDFWVIWAAVLFGMTILIVIPLIRSTSIAHPVRIATPVILACVAVLLLIFKTPINLNLPSEISPSARASWDIAKSVLQESPLFGTGPGTWIYDYAKYRSPAVNLSQFWTVRFERGLTTFFSLIAMIGLVGILLWLMLVLSSVVKSVMHLIKEKDDDTWQAYVSVFSGWATIAFLAFFYNYNFAHHMVFWFLLALLVALIVKRAYVWEAKKGSASSIVISIIFVVLSVSALSVAWLAGQRLAADAAYSSAVFAYRQTKPIDEVIDSLNRAVAMNRWNDVYYRNLSQGYLIKGGLEFAQLKQDDPQGPARVNQIISAAIDTGRLAAEINPSNIDNWENMAVIYQSISPVIQGADEFAIQNFEKALEREPNNPVYSNEIGKIHITRADTLTALLQSAEEEQKNQAEQQIKDELDKAAEWLNRSIQAKPDFAPAHYFLGLVYERQGRIQDAIVKLEQVLSVNQQDVGVAFQLAILYYRNEQKDDSLNMFEQIVKVTPDYANARWYLSVLYEEKGRIQEAIDQVKAIQDKNQDNEAVAERLAYLEGLLNKKEEAPPAEGLPNPVEEKISGPEAQNPIQAPEKAEVPPPAEVPAQ